MEMVAGEGETCAATRDPSLRGLPNHPGLASSPTCTAEKWRILWWEKCRRAGHYYAGYAPAVAPALSYSSLFSWLLLLCTNATLTVACKAHPSKALGPGWACGEPGVGPHRHCEHPIVHQG